MWLQGRRSSGWSGRGRYYVALNRANDRLSNTIDWLRFSQCGPRSIKYVAGLANCVDHAKHGLQYYYSRHPRARRFSLYHLEFMIRAPSDLYSTGPLQFHGPAGTPAHMLV